MAATAPLLDPMAARAIAAANYWGLTLGLRSMRAVSLKLGVNANHVGQIYRKTVLLPSVSLLERLVKAGFDGDWLLLGRGAALRDGSTPALLAGFAPDPPRANRNLLIQFSPVPRPQWLTALTPAA